MYYLEPFREIWPFVTVASPTLMQRRIMQTVPLLSCRRPRARLLPVISGVDAVRVAVPRLFFQSM